jgi:hypothetical protein
MWRAQGSQKDLFDEATQVAELRPELRAKLTLLVQVLLSEAACLERGGLGGKEVGDDQDHA